MNAERRVIAGISRVKLENDRDCRPGKCLKAGRANTKMGISGRLKCAKRC
jgi:hypothetical protein